MLLPPFKYAIGQFPEPFKTLVGIVNYYWSENYFSNYVIWGNYDNKDEPVKMNVWSIVGIAPRYENFLECHVCTTEEEKPYWISKLREIALALTINPKIESVNLNLLGGIIRGKLGKDKVHVIGMITLHQIIKSKQDFAVLWTHPDLQRDLVEYILKKVLEVRL